MRWAGVCSSAFASCQKTWDARLSRPAQEHASDILNALLALGYSEKEASHAVKGLAPGIAVAEGIRAALRALAKR